MLFSEKDLSLVDLKRIVEIIVVAIVFSASVAPMGVQVPFFFLIIISLFILIFDRTHNYFELSRYDVLVLVAMLLNPIAVIVNMMLHGFWDWSELDNPARYIYATSVYLVLRKFLINESSKRLIMWGCLFGLLASTLFFASDYSPGVRAQVGYSHPISFGNVVAIQIAVLTVFLFSTRSRNLFILLIIACTGGLACIVASGTRGSFLVLIASIVPLVLCDNRNRNMLVILFGIALFFVILIGTNQIGRLLTSVSGFKCFITDGSICDGSVSMRLEMYRVGLIAWRDNIFTGWGVGNAQQAVEVTIASSLANVADGFRSFDHLHNEFLSTLLEQGVVGAFGLVASISILLGLGLKISLTHSITPGRAPLEGILCLTFVAGVTISGFSQVNSGHADMISYIAVTTGIYFALASGGTANARS